MRSAPTPGGPTRVWNETAVCATCHALIHEGLLAVTGNAVSGLEWTPRKPRPRVDISHEARKLDATIIQFHPSPDSTRVESTAYEGLDALVRGLTRLGYERAEAREKLEKAIAELIEEGAELVDERILQQALCPQARPSFEKEYARQQAAKERGMQRVAE